MKIDIKSLAYGELGELMLSLGEKKFRAEQVFRWLHQKQVESFDEMSDLSASLREKLKENCTLTVLKPLLVQKSSDGTMKILFELPDENTIETVVMCHNYGTSLCISSQVGCRMGCKFCASTVGGKVRDLKPSEMLEQVYRAGKIAERKIDSIVMMGIGEPLDNFENVIRFLELIKDPKGLEMSHRHISLSTSGLCDAIDQLAQLKLQLTLSISLHAADNGTRTSIMPVNKAYPIDRLMKSCKNYFKVTGRRISYEFALISGVNDNKETAEALIKLLKGQSCHVNLIPINPVEGKGFQRPDKAACQRFRGILEKAGISATIRRELGTDIDAACGQLRRKHREGEDANTRCN